VAPIKLERFPGVKYQWDINFRYVAALLLPPLSNVAPDTVVAARVAFPLKPFIEGYGGATLPLGELLVPG
jgi:hypothetical protein